jgi:hypothetical protein
MPNAQRIWTATDVGSMSAFSEPVFRPVACDDFRRGF